MDTFRPQVLVRAQLRRAKDCQGCRVSVPCVCKRLGERGGRQRELSLTKDGKVVVVEALRAVRPCWLEPVPRLQQPTDPHVPDAQFASLSGFFFFSPSRLKGRNATAKRL